MAASPRLRVVRRRLLQAVPVVDRNYQDPLPPVLRLLWPLVQAATQLVGPRLSAAQLAPR